MPDSPTGPQPPSGRQFVLENEAARATVTEVGAGLRTLSVGGTDLVWGYRGDEMAGGGRGQVLAPWPNRLADGRYTFDGRSGRAAIDEPARNNAIHGLVRWLNWQLDCHEADNVRLSIVLAAQPAYPWRLRLSVAYHLTPGGLTIATTVENLGDGVAPVGLGFHPYLAAGQGRADSCSLSLPASVHLLADDRALPSGREDVAGTAFDFRSGTSLSGVQLDDCFTAVGGTAGADMPEGAAWEAVLVTPAGRLGLWADDRFGYVMCFTGDTLAPADRRCGVAVEPMTCPPNALATGDASLWALDAGATESARWGIRLLG
ncbi:MAG TPA: aldose 1-epimerase family protein [Acidimicrobiales bacterium]|jgi:aldose 1-epimerase|nr:aldose 1-epimerase family protein [Acidimicrobiales bacterium]